MFFKVKIKKVSKRLKNEDVIGREFFLFCTEDKAYKIGKTNEMFDFKYSIDDGVLIGKSICRCDEKDIFLTKIPLSKMNKSKFTAKSVIVKPHQDEKTPYKINEYVVLEFVKDDSIKTKEQAERLFRNSNTKKSI